MSEAALARPEPPPVPSLTAGLGVAAAVVTAIIGWLALGSSFLNETTLFGGFMVLWYWAKVEHLSTRRLPATIIGALAGIGVAWAMYYAGSHYGAAGFAGGLLLLIIAIYLDIVQVMPLFVNASTMLFSIVAAAPLVQLKVNWGDLCLATVGGGIFFGSYVAVAAWLARKITQQST